MASRSRRGISPVLATLILIVIAVVAGLVVYGWIMGWIGTQKQQVAFAVRVIRTNSTAYTVEVRNTGSTTVTVSKVSVTDSDETKEASVTAGELDPGESVVVVVKVTDTDDVGDEVTVIVTTTDKGSFTYKVTVAG